MIDGVSDKMIKLLKQNDYDLHKISMITSKNFEITSIFEQDLKYLNQTNCRYCS